jgi:hypothetical protein
METFLSMFGPAISPQLQDKLSSRNTQLIEVLDDETCARGYRSNFGALVNFLVEHVSELLSLALNLDDIPHSTKAFTLLSSPGELIPALLSNQSLPATIKNYLKKSAYDVTINRLAVITGAAFASDPENAGVALGDFIPYLQYRSVFEMFVGFCGEDAKARTVQAFLKDLNFVGEVLEAVAALPGVIADADGAYATALFKLVPIIRGSDLGPQITTDSALERLLRIFLQAPISVQNAQWAAVRSVVTDENLKTLGTQLKRILALVPPSEPTYAAYQVTGIRLAQRLVVQNAYREQIIAAGFPATLVAVLKSFPRHTIAQTAVADFISAVAQYGGFGQAFLDAVLPVATEALRAGTIEERGFAWGLLKKVKQLAENKVGEEDWAAFEEVDAIVEKPYGGDPPKPSALEPGDGAPNQQMIQLLLQMLAASRK